MCVSVPAFQVRLVLEYCDKGCLRDALDDGIFLLGESENELAGWAQECWQSTCTEVGPDLRVCHPFVCPQTRAASTTWPCWTPVLT